MNQGNLPSIPAALTALADDANPGDTQVRVASAAGLRQGARPLVGAPGTDGSEPATVVGTPDSGTGIVHVTGLLNSHRAGDAVAAGDAHGTNDLGGTSSATPLIAGICALVLSSSPRLMWVEVREILRATAVKFDTANNNPVGRWPDIDGVPVNTSGGAPVFSRWYGYGHLDADAAVRAALAYDFPRDLMIRKDLDDEGDRPSPPSADSPDIWVRNTDPAHDAGALPSGYDVAGPHEHPAGAGGRWIYARVKNRGTQPSLDAWARFYVASFDGQLEWARINENNNLAEKAIAVADELTPVGPDADTSAES